MDSANDSHLPRSLDQLNANLIAAGALNQPVEPSEQRWAAVLALFSAETDPDLVFTVRSAQLHHHPGQISFPGGGREASDSSPVATALREANEEIGLDPAQVHVLGGLPTQQVVVSNNAVIPVVGWWTGDASIEVADTAEVAEVFRWRVSELVNPAHRVMARHPSGFVGPAWDFEGLFMWGLTARLVDQMLNLGGWAQPWDEGQVVAIPPQFRNDAWRR